MITRSTRKVSSSIELDTGWTLKDFLDKVEKMITGFEPEYLTKLRVDFETELDEYAINMVIWHDRPETDEELTSYITKEVMRSIHAAEAQETKERAALEALKARYDKEDTE